MAQHTVAIDEVSIYPSGKKTCCNVKIDML